jgi:hypothetical protein
MVNITTVGALGDVLSMMNCHGVPHHQQMRPTSFTFLQV